MSSEEIFLDVDVLLGKCNLIFRGDDKFLTAVQGLDEHLEFNFYGLVIGQQDCFVFSSSAH